MRQTRWYLVAALLGLALAQSAGAEGQPETRGDPKTTYDQSQNGAHSGRTGGSDTASTAVAMSTSSQVSTSTTNQTEAAGHWLVRQVHAASGGSWRLYDTGEVKRAGDF